MQANGRCSRLTTFRRAQQLIPRSIPLHVRIRHQLARAVCVTQQCFFYLTSARLLPLLRLMPLLTYVWYPYPRARCFGTQPKLCNPGGQHAPPLRLSGRQPRAHPLPPTKGGRDRQQPCRPSQRVRKPEAKARQVPHAGGPERRIGDAAAAGGGRG